MNNFLRTVGYFLSDVCHWIAIGFLGALYLAFSILSIVITVMMFALFIFAAALAIVLCWKLLAVALV